MQHERSFASDNNAGVHPDVMQTLLSVNVRHAVGYGNDGITRAAESAFKKLFGEDVSAFFVFGGTAANVLGLRTMANSYNGVICASTAHMQGSECGASENFIGCKLLPVPTMNGKITVQDLEKFKNEPNNPHSIQPKVVSLTQPTEYGTVYSVEEIEGISEYAEKQGWYVHMDGARIANAIACLGVSPMEATGYAGVDVLSFGGTKNGMMFGEAVLFFDPRLAANFPYIRMQGMQLASKMRFISAQFAALLNNDLWLKNARHANYMAQDLRSQLGGIPYVYFTQPTETNQVFAMIPKRVIPALQEEFFFYVWNEACTDNSVVHSDFLRYYSEVRFVTSFDTTHEDIDEFCACLRKLIEREGAPAISTEPIGEKGIAQTEDTPNGEAGGILRI